MKRDQFCLGEKLLFSVNIPSIVVSVTLLMICPYNRFNSI